MSRKLYLAALIQEAKRIIQEAGEQPPQPQQQAVPPSPVPPAPATNAPPPTPSPEAPQPPEGAGEVKPFDIDALIDRLNVIRGGKSFADPEVYGQLTTWFKSTNEADKAVIDRFLQSIGKIVIQVDTNQQTTTSGNTQPPMNQTPPVTPTVPSMGGAPVQESLGASELISESIKEGMKFKFAGKEMEFGSPEHLRVLRGLLHGLQNLRDCYSLGSANRHIYAQACHKIRKLIAKHMPEN